MAVPSDLSDYVVPQTYEDNTTYCRTWDQGLAPGTKVSYRVQTVLSDGSVSALSASSNGVQATGGTGVPTPVGLEGVNKSLLNLATGKTESGVELIWLAADGCRYLVSRLDTETSTWVPLWSGEDVYLTAAPGSATISYLTTGARTRAALGTKWRHSILLDPASDPA